MKKYLLTGLLMAAFAAQAQTLDQLNIGQINPDLANSFDKAGSVVIFYGENYLVDAPQTCTGPIFSRTCQVTLSHLRTNPGVDVNINQQILDGVLVTAISARPDGKQYTVTYHQKGPNTVMTVLNVSRVWN